MQQNNIDVTILGGGVMGFSIAYNLAKRGVSCQVIEMDSIAAKASGRNEGGVSSPALLGIFFATPFSHHMLCSLVQKFSRRPFLDNPSW